MSKGMYKIFRTKQDLYNFVCDIERRMFKLGLTIGNSFAIDSSLIALGRMDESHRKEFLTLYLQAAEEVVKDYGELIHSDYYENNDKDLWYSADKMDKELREYLGDISLPPFDERYHRNDIENYSNNLKGEKNVK